MNLRQNGPQAESLCTSHLELTTSAMPHEMAGVQGENRYRMPQLMKDRKLVNASGCAGQQRVVAGHIWSHSLKKTTEYLVWPLPFAGLVSTLVLELEQQPII